MKKSLIVIGAALVVLAFQNCQKAALTTSGDPEGKLMAVTANDPEDASGAVVQPAGDDSLQTPGTGAQQPPDDGKGPEVPPVDGGNPGSGNPGNGHPGNGNANGKDKGGNYVCILEGPGKSVKLGLGQDDKAGGQNKIPRVLCMSQNACLNIASQVFGVKGPEKRGYCKLPQGNPHVFHITDAQMQVKVDELKTP